MTSLEQELARWGAELLERRLAGFGPVLLARLALLPEWTDDLAAATGTGSAAEFDRLEDAGLLERRRVLGPRGRRQQAFWVRGGVRDDVAAHVRVRLGAELAVALADLVRDVQRAGAGTPAVTAWLLAASLRDEPTGLELVEGVERLIDGGDPAAAARLVTAAEVIGQVTGGPLADAARRAAWRVDRLARAADDAEHLRHYLHRDEAEAALTDLILGDDGPWALHLLGGGGTGKTMLVRHLASGRFAEGHGRAPFPVARADFDHLDPRYPEQRPGELLHALAGELLGYGMRQQTSRAFRGFEDASLALTEELARATPDRARVDSLLRATVHGFAAFAGSLPSPVVLVLDTCEELVKLYPPGAPAPGIEHTFRVLELLKEVLPQLRVVLAGRRWLVPPSSELLSPEWLSTGPLSTEPEPLVSGPVLTAKPYVRVLRLGGFTEEEARGYLELRAPAMAAALGEAVLARARAGSATTRSSCPPTRTGPSPNPGSTP
ncbi:hypothetical protein OIE66_20395 [Nonomuraea sp. NBC_01738]|uniref:AAA family ATPase n=1 Tax=Nonomuraea sp. NBC_01738 TaxID=2976003 RepID=UPI002E0DD762|nr:hypothetical protein OIE66_20395 [Nonomuraea sp. NBC_01738]